MQMMRARRLDLNGSGHGAPPSTPESRPTPAWESDDGCSLVLTPSERSFLEAAFRDLTRREREVIFALCTGGTNEGMAERLCIALPTLRTHLMRLNQKLGTSSKGDVVRVVAMHLLDAYRTRRIELAPGAEAARRTEAGALA